MATINFEDHGKRGTVGGTPANNTANSAGIAGWNFDRTISVTLALAAVLKVNPGQYEHVGEDSSGNWKYAPATRGSL